MGYVYLAASRGSPGLLKIGHTKGDPQKRIAQLQTGSPHRIRLVHAIAVPDPLAVERRLHRHFAAVRKQGEWFQVTASEARRAMYAIAEDAASIDAQKEFDRFRNDIGGFGFGLVMYLLAMLLLVAGLVAGFALAAALGDFGRLDKEGKEILLGLGTIIGILAGFFLIGTILDKIRRAVFATQITEKARKIEQEYKEKYGVEVTLAFSI